MTRETLERDGFAGFRPFRRLWPEGLEIVPAAGGVYAVLRASASEPVFLESNPGGRFKGRDPFVPIEELHRNWVPGAAPHLRTPRSTSPTTVLC
ncbi:MAG: hypothetical protein U0R69_13370 [Gaiellales bacterium]